MLSDFTNKLEQLNTDYLGYSDVLNSGFPQSSPKTRIFTPVKNNYSINSVIQYPKGYTKEYLEHKLQRRHLNMYFQKLSNTSDKVIDAVGEFINNYSNKQTLYQIPCDVVVCSKTSATTNNISLIHLHYPNEWSAQDAIGKPFNYFHKDVIREDGRSIVPDHYKLIDNFIHSGKFYERVGAFSIRKQPQLDLHPNIITKNGWKKGEKLKDVFLRFERQVVAGLPIIDSFIFLIHTYFVSASSKPKLLKNAIVNRDKYCYPRKVIDSLEKELIECCDTHINNQSSF